MNSNDSTTTTDNNQQWLSLLPQHHATTPSPPASNNNNSATTRSTTTDVSSNIRRLWVVAKRHLRTAANTVTATTTAAANNSHSHSHNALQQNDAPPCLQDPLLIRSDNSNSLNDDCALLSPASNMSGDGDVASPCRQRQHHPSSSSTPIRGRPTNNSNTSLNTIHNRYAREMIRRAGNYLAYTTLLTMLLVIPIMAYHGLKHKKVASAAIRSAGVMAFGTVIISTRLVYLHLSHWYMPAVQKYVVRILWMVPLYAVQSWLSLWFHQARLYIDAIRDLYEAYVIASFVYYLMELLGGQEALIHLLRYKAFHLNNSSTNSGEGHDIVHENANSSNGLIHHHDSPDNGVAMQVDHPSPLGQHAFPLSLILQPWALGMEFMLQCKHGVLQYVVVKVLCTFFTVVCEFFSIYGEGKFEVYYAYPYICFFQNISVMYALYCLVLLFSAINDELRHPVDWRPLGKFLCVKGVVFFTWWQGVVIFYLKAHGIFDHVGSWSSNEVANGLIDYCVCIEMVGFAMAHSYTFSFTDYLPSNFPMEYRQRVHSNHGHDNSNDNSNNIIATPDRRNHHYDHQNNRHDDHGNDHGEQDCELGDDYARPRPRLQRGSSSFNSNTNGATTTCTTTYRPPAILDQPMAFKKAFWDSTVPKETIQDIQTLRASVDDIVFQASRPRLFSLPKLNNKNNQEDRGATSEDTTGTSTLLPPRLVESMSLILFPSSNSSSSKSNTNDDTISDTHETTALVPPTLRESTSLISFPTTSLSTFPSSSFASAPTPTAEAEITITSAMSTAAAQAAGTETTAEAFSVFPAAVADLLPSPQSPPHLPGDDDKKEPPQTDYSERSVNH
jgi:hypothetical protein